MKYQGFDIVAGENVDVVGDAHQLSKHFSSKTFDFCFSVSVFEHLMWPWKVVLELNDVMKVGGMVFAQSHPTWPKHEIPWDFFSILGQRMEGAILRSHGDFAYPIRWRPSVWI